MNPSNTATGNQSNIYLDSPEILKRKQGLYTTPGIVFCFTKMHLGKDKDVYCVEVVPDSRINASGSPKQ